MTPTDAPKSASALAVAELVERMRAAHTIDGICDFDTVEKDPSLRDDWVSVAVAMDACTLIEQQSTSIRELEDANARLRARLQELERDAARYRWLRSNCQYAFEDRDEPQLVHRNGETASSQNSRWREDLDAAIDAALAADAGEPL
jgi:hypothetical protein